MHTHASAREHTLLVMIQRCVLWVRSNHERMQNPLFFIAKRSFIPWPMMGWNVALATTCELLIWYGTRHIARTMYFTIA